ncbi:MAG: hypothetical protein KIT84_38330 [Labilithrix sp.]|nr:hypothetical protein [Labilithrix sp.]MCW5816918.1 hypothetical protein [Labilithrix sp.]
MTLGARHARKTERFLALLVLAAALFAVCAPGPAGAQADPGAGVAAKAYEHTVAMEYDKARELLAKADPSSPSVALAKARLALYEEDCDLSAALMLRHDAMAAEDARVIADVARGCARVTAATVVDKDDAAGVVVRWQDEDDRALFPLMIETVNAARQSLTRDLGVEWKRPTRITVVRDLLSLSAMTGLPYKSAQTTGTVAVAKWGRVTLLSPRASRHGYAWRDTLTHELTHLAISMQSRERAPLWLHEGVARRQEVRWRDPGPFDDRPSTDSVVMRGMELKLDLPLDKLGPSIAMLPSADAAMVAFAEVSSFVRFFVESSAPDALPKLLVALRSANAVDDALKQVSGETLAQWDVKWRAELARKPKEPLSPLYGLGGPLPGGGDSHERARLAELLLARGHAAEAFMEIEKVPESLLADTSLRYIRGRVLEAKGDVAGADAMVDDPKAWIASFGPCWALRARLAKGTPAGNAAASEALAHDPLSVEAACGTVGAAPAPSPSVPLCDAANKRGEPDIGHD